ncbi:MAG: BlaI/MecI/CopY family transcriptional regulator [Bacteroidota bacterium]|jgi:predicted transcriptional regulator
METLSKTELAIMEYIWRLEKCFLNDLISILPKPKPAKTTLATLLKRMQNKNFVGYTTYGNSRQYYALISKEDYFAKTFKSIVSIHFQDSYKEFGLFFAENANLNLSELVELKSALESEIEKFKNSEAVFY